MDWTEIQRILKRWFKRATTLDEVVWEGEAAKHGDRPHGILHIFATRNVGTDERRQEYDDTQPEGKRIVWTVSGMRLFTLSCRVRSRDNNPGKAAIAYLEKARTSLAKLSTLEMFRGAELAFVGAEAVNDLPGLYQDRMESFANMDVQFTAVVNETDTREQGTYIETIEVTSNVDGWPNSVQLDAEEMP